MQARTIEWLRWIGVAALCVGFAAGRPAPAHAQADRVLVSADYKAAIGGGLIGAELGAVIPALAGLDATWAYIVFPVVGAAGGAVGGYFAIDKPGHVNASVAVLTAGMALVIPALVLTLSETAYDPARDAESAQSARAKQLARARHEAQRRAAAGPGLVRMEEGNLALAAPGIALVPSQQGGALHVAGLSLAVVSGAF